MLPYQRAQVGMAEIKSAIYELLGQAPSTGLTNAQIGRTLGIYQGHVRHQGHIPRSLLSIMEDEGVVEQDKATKRWRLRRSHADEDESSVEQ
jgi:DNA-binding IclR family transcriptional regulator